MDFLRFDAEKCTSRPQEGDDPDLRRIVIRRP